MVQPAGARASLLRLHYPLASASFHPATSCYKSDKHDILPALRKHPETNHNTLINNN